MAALAFLVDTVLVILRTRGGELAVSQLSFIALGFACSFLSEAVAAFFFEYAAAAAVPAITFSWELHLVDELCWNACEA